MFLQSQKIAKHALELCPTHIRNKKPHALNFRRIASRGGSYFASHGIMHLLAHRNQRCVVKISYTKNTKTRSWAAHGEYLQRHHAQTKGEQSLGFDYNKNTVDLRSTLSRWQQENDEHLFRVIISPENGNKLDLKQHAKDLMQLVQNDFNTKLEWVAIDHHNTDHPHLHILIRGVDERGKTLIIDRDYLSHGFRHRSEDIATRVLGLRLNRDIIQARTNQLEREYVTELDRSIIRKAKNLIVNYNAPAQNNLLTREQRLLEIGRLKFLEQNQLAEKIGTKAWRINDKLELILKQWQLSNDIIKSRAHHNIQTLTHEMPSPTEINENAPLTGKVVGLGLENELKDQRYLLVEGIDGKVHYLRATNSIVKARDNFELNTNDIITLEKHKFFSENCGVIEYIRIQNHHSLENLQKELHSRLDQDVIKFVKMNAALPNQPYPEHSFAHQYANLMMKRANEFEQEKIFIKKDGQHCLSNYWEKKLATLNEKRRQNFAEQKNSNSNKNINKKIQDNKRGRNQMLDRSY